MNNEKNTPCLEDLKYWVIWNDAILAAFDLASVPGFKPTDLLEIMNVRPGTNPVENGN